MINFFEVSDPVVLTKDRTWRGDVAEVRDNGTVIVNFTDETGRISRIGVCANDLQLVTNSTYGRNSR